MRVSQSIKYLPSLPVNPLPSSTAMHSVNVSLHIVHIATFVFTHLAEIESLLAVHLTVVDLDKDISG